MSDNPEQYLIDRAHKYNQRLAEFTFLEGERQVEFAKETVELQRANQEAQLGLQDRAREQDWERATEIQRLKQEADMKAYDKSEDVYHRQLGLNTEALQGATRGAKNRKYERELELEFNKRKTNLEAYGSKLKLDAFRKEAAFKGADNFLEGIQNIGAVSNNIGRSAIKEKVSAISQTAGKAAALSEQINSQESLFNLELLGADNDRLAHHETGLSIKRKNVAELDKIGHSYKQATLQADARRMAKPMMMPPIAKPELLPRQEFQDPRPYVRGPLPVPGVGYTQAGGGGGGGGGGVGGALSMAGSTMTALAAAGNVGAFGVTASFGPMLGPIGIAVVGVGLLGEALDWW